MIIILFTFYLPLIYPIFFASLNHEQYDLFYLKEISKIKAETHTN
jgi:hypothetical protein